MVNELHPSHPLSIFLCHSFGDKPIVRKLHQQLCDDGFKPWLDEKDLLPGQDWHQEIIKAVRDSDVVAVCLSRSSVSKRGYVQREIKFALDVADEQPEDTIFIIPLKLEECDVPTRLKRWQWVNLFEEGGYERLIRALRHRTASSNALLRPSIKANKGILELVSWKDQIASSRKHSILGKRLLSIVLALITGIVTLIAGYWQFIYKPSHGDANDKVQYAGRVRDAMTQQVISGAKVSIEVQGIPQIYYTDMDGVFNMKLPSSTAVVRIRVDASGYQIFERNTSPSRNKAEDIRLIPNSNISSPVPAPTDSLMPTTTTTPVRPPRKHPKTSQPKREDPALDILRGAKKDGSLGRRN
jgi:hypothetical protein